MKTLDRSFIDHIPIGECEGWNNRQRIAAASLIQFAATLLESPIDPTGQMTYPRLWQEFERLYGRVSVDAITKEVAI